MTAPVVGVRAAGEAALLLECADLAGVWRVAAALRDAPPDGTVEVVPGARTVLVLLDPAVADVDGLAELLRTRTWPEASGNVAEGQRVELPVVYDGADLADVARLAGLSEDEVVTRHTAAEYTVAFLGFAPGFPYLLGLDPALHVPRLDTPRSRVPAGSVGLAGEQTGIYTTATPGGWRLLGRTLVRLFDAGRSPPALLAPGDRVRFAVATAPVAADSGVSGRSRTAGAAKAHDRRGGERRQALVGPGGGTVTVLDPGGLLTVQDRGRFGYADSGVPRTGALDPDALRLANRLVGNPDGAAGLEATLPAPGLRLRLRLDAPGPVAVVGGGASVHLDGRAVPAGTGLPALAGSVVEVGPLRAGVRTWLAVGGGIAVPGELGSRSTDALGQLGPPPVQAGDMLRLGQPGAAARSGRFLHQPVEPPADQARVVLGPRADALGDGGAELLLSTSWVVGAGDRVGLRLDGPALPLRERSSLPSEGMLPGALQVPPDGHPVALLAGAGTTGGYPVVAVVASVDLGRLAGLRSGDSVRFSAIPASEARELRRRRDAALARAVQDPLTLT